MEKGISLQQIEVKLVKRGGGRGEGGKEKRSRHTTCKLVHSSESLWSRETPWYSCDPSLSLAWLPGNRGLFTPTGKGLELFHCWNLFLCVHIYWWENFGYYFVQKEAIPPQLLWSSPAFPLPRGRTCRQMTLLFWAIRLWMTGQVTYQKIHTR